MLLFSFFLFKQNNYLEDYCDWETQQRQLTLLQGLWAMPRFLQVCYFLHLLKHLTVLPTHSPHHLPSETSQENMPPLDNEGFCPNIPWSHELSLGFKEKNRAVVCQHSEHLSMKARTTRTPSPRPPVHDYALGGNHVLCHTRAFAYFPTASVYQIL